MKTIAVAIAAFLGFSGSLSAVVYTSGAYGHTFQGYAQAIGPISNFQNGSNLGSSMAVIGTGPELWTEFNDVFGTPWHLTVDFQDNYQVVVQTHSSNPSGNISGGTVGFNLLAFDFQIQDFQPVTIPPYMSYSAGLNQQNQSIWIGFGSLAAWEPYNTYVFQIVPVPEPGTLALFALGVVVAARQRRRLPL